ncbi:chaplin family protein [Streptomyces sp. NPDC127051]|uniref:chaplin family protein n=1 Tax=Streptomyces sp. NPDC127051 TaxID=3347119 RepID=UPI00365054D9
MALSLGAGAASADASSEGMTSGSAGVRSGRVAQYPIHVPVGACGLTAEGVGLVASAVGTSCGNN